MEDDIDLVTCSAPINIAVIKYWGKQCSTLNLPLNSSLSLTLHQNDLKSLTTAATSKRFTEDRIWVNGEEQDVENNNRMKVCLSEIRRLARMQAIRRGETAQDVTKYSRKVHICSRNDFPTAAGLASSAAGYAALVASMGRLFNIEGDLSPIARRGSGSACRSIYGGFVEWLKSKDACDGSDSVAVQLFDEDYWPGLRVFILVTCSHRKSTGSTAGMQRSVETSSLLQYRVSEVVPERLEVARKAIENRDFEAFAEICMKESNQLHAICQDTFPPLHYLKDSSRDIVEMVHSYNQLCGEVRLAYTFDAGSNAFLFTLEPYANEIAKLLRHSFSKEHQAGDFIKGLCVNDGFTTLDLQKFERRPSAVEYIIYTRGGPGPLLSLKNDDLISRKTGLPL